MNPPCRNPVLVIVVLWAIAIATTAFLFMGSPAILYGILIQGICMIGSATYLKQRETADCRAV